MTSQLEGNGAGQLEGNRAGLEGNGGTRWLEVALTFFYIKVFKYVFRYTLCLHKNFNAPKKIKAIYDLKGTK